jgi:hypothetical protein
VAAACAASTGRYESSSVDYCHSTISGILRDVERMITERVCTQAPYLDWIALRSGFSSGSGLRTSSSSDFRIGHDGSTSNVISQ